MAGIEPATDGLRNRCSTAELHWHPANGVHKKPDATRVVKFNRSLEVRWLDFGTFGNCTHRDTANTERSPAPARYGVCEPSRRAGAGRSVVVSDADGFENGPAAV